MALQFMHRSNRHPDLSSWGAPIHEMIERKLPAPDYTGEPGDLFPPNQPDTSYFDGYSEYADPTYCGCSECLEHAEDDDERAMIAAAYAEDAMNRRYALSDAASTALVYASVLTLDEINFHGGFIVTTNRSYT